MSKKEEGEDEEEEEEEEKEEEEEEEEEKEDPSIQTFLINNKKSRAKTTNTRVFDPYSLVTPYSSLKKRPKTPKKSWTQEVVMLHRGACALTCSRSPQTPVAVHKVWPLGPSTRGAH